MSSIKHQLLVVILGLQLFAFTANAQSSSGNGIMTNPPAWLNELNNNDQGTRKEEHVCKSGEYLGRVKSTIYSGTGNSQSGAAYTIWGRNSGFTCPETSTGIYSQAFGWNWDNYDGGIAVCLWSSELGVLMFTSFNWVGTATGGNCAGLTPIEAGMQDTDTSAQVSVRLTGVGCDYEDFDWTFDGENGNLGTAPNTGQTFTCITSATLTASDTDTSSSSSTGTIGSIPISVGVEGDPHFKTWTSQYYDFMGACDLQLIYAPNFDGNKNALTIHIRTRIRYEYSYIESAVVKMGHDTLEVGSYGEWFLNGVDGGGNHHHRHRYLGHLSGFPVVHSNPQENLYRFQIQISTEPREGETINLKVYKDMVSVTFDKPHKERFNGSLGMMGEFATGRLLARDGRTELPIDNPNAIAAEWQVRENEPVLFQTIQGPQHPQQCQLPPTSSSSSKKTPTTTVGGGGVNNNKSRLGAPPTLAAREENANAMAACQKAGAKNLKGCIHDVMTTGDINLAAASAY